MGKDLIVDMKRKGWNQWIIYRAECKNFRKFVNSNSSHIFDKKSFLFIIFRKGGNNEEIIFKEEESTEILKILGLIK